MMSVINTNTISLNAQRNLSTNSASLATSIQRLSSGQRINSAKDDAAGLAISERFTTQIRGMNQAARNANDGISLAQTAEGALGEIGNNLQRIRELSVQSRNATNSDSDRTALNAEVTQLKAEIQRVSEQTSFNDKKLLDGSFTAQAFQVGANQGQTIEIASIANANIAALGSWTSVDTPNTSAVSGAFTAANLADTEEFSFEVDGVEILSVTAAADDTAVTAADIDTALASQTVRDNLATAGITVSGTAAAGTLSFTKADATAFDITVTSDDAAAGFATAEFVGTQDNGEVGAAQTGFANLDISTAEGADNAILAMDAALNAVNSSRAELGAVQNRFSSVVANLQTGSENLSASRSRIMDTDFAKETAELSRTQVLQQAGTAMLAQANQLPNNVLSLLR
ncbi:flagellin [Luteimonas sp. WGS1318]|uniref:flagellin n=1 Tax=Luteimonas sp. WGS1318 TaxID=3366815 RepID=UPI00372D2668